MGATETEGIGAYVLDVGTGEVVDVFKASAQAEPERTDTGVRPWIEPRHAASDLLHFFDTNTWHRRCVRLVAVLSAGLGWTLERDPDAEAGAGDADGETRATKLLRRCNDDGEAWEDVAVKVVTDLIAVGYAGLEVVRNGKGEPCELHHVPARTLRRAKDRKAFYQVTKPGGRPVRFLPFGAKKGTAGRPGARSEPHRGPRSELVWLSSYDPRDDFYGAPEWLPALGAMALDRSALAYNVGMFSNSMLGVTALVVEGGKLDPAAVETVKGFIARTATGTENAGRVLVLQQDRDTAKIRIEKLSVETKDLGFTAGRAALRDEVVSAHGVPPRLVGIVASGQIGATGEVEGQLQMFREASLRPVQRVLSGALRPVLAALGAGAWRVRLSEIDVTDLKADAAFYGAMLAGGVLDAKDVRARIDGRRG